MASDELPLTESQFSMFIAVCYMTITEPENFEVVEALIAVLLSLCAFSISPYWDLRFLPPKSCAFKDMQDFLNGSLLPILRQVIVLAFVCYTVWFWFVGVDVLPLSPCTGSAFFFARVNIFTWFRVIGKIFTIFQAVLITAVLLLPCPLPPDVGRKRGQLMYAVSGSLVIIFALSSVEMMIIWNNVRGVGTVNSVGQLIPFLLGFSGLLTVVLEWGELLEEPAPQASRLDLFR